MVSRGPVTMTVEQRADDSAVQHAGKRFVPRLRLPFGNDFAIFGKASDAQTVGIRRATSPARIFGSVLFLKRLRFFHRDADLQMNVIPSEARNLSQISLITLPFGRVTNFVGEILRIRSG